VNSCLVRIPGTINSKCGRAVNIVKQWDGQKLAIQYLLRQFRIWLTEAKVEERRQFDCKRTRVQAISSTKTIWWIEKLLQTPIDDYRKFTV